MAKLEDQAARANTMFGADADWINFETVVSTSGNQIALAPGYLQKSWKENGRSYYQYKMDQKMMPFFAYLSADWQVKKATGTASRSRSTTTASTATTWTG
jgi:ABC-2 type transport system permease protein